MGSWDLVASHAVGSHAVESSAMCGFPGGPGGRPGDGGDSRTTPGEIQVTGRTRPGMGSTYTRGMGHAS